MSKNRFYLQDVYSAFHLVTIHNREFNFVASSL